MSKPILKSYQTNNTYQHKGGPLTIAEFEQNFIDIRDAIQSLKDHSVVSDGTAVYHPSGVELTSLDGDTKSMVLVGSPISPLSIMSSHSILTKFPNLGVFQLITSQSGASSLEMELSFFKIGSGTFDVVVKLGSTGTTTDANIASFSIGADVQLSTVNVKSFIQNLSTSFSMLDQKGVSSVEVPQTPIFKSQSFSGINLAGNNIVSVWASSTSQVQSILQIIGFTTSNRKLNTGSLGEYQSVISPTPVPALSGTWNYVVGDDFDVFYAERYKIGPWWGADKNDDGTNNVSVSGGVLKIQPSKNASTNLMINRTIATDKMWTSKTDRLSYVEVKYKLKSGAGRFPNIWLSNHTQTGVPARPELDIMETGTGPNWGDGVNPIRIKATSWTDTGISAGNPDPNNQTNQSAQFVPATPLVNNFHTAGALLDPKNSQVTYYCDGTAFATHTIDSAAGSLFLYFGEWFDGGFNVGTPADPADLVSKEPIEFDYWRVWEQSYPVDTGGGDTGGGDTGGGDTGGGDTGGGDTGGGDTGGGDTGGGDTGGGDTGQVASTAGTYSLGSSVITAGSTGTAPVWTSTPLIAGQPSQRSILVANVGTWINQESISFSFQWLIDGLPIDRAIGGMILVPDTTNMIGREISCAVTANGPNGTLTVITNKKTITSNSGTYLAPTLFSGEVQTVQNPVCAAISAIQGATTYNVGPGQSYLEPDTVPWADLKAGDVVNIFYRPEPYNHIVTVDVIGTEAAPVIINGVTDANGNRPIFDVSVNGVVAASTEVFYAGRDVSHGWQRLGVFNVLTRPGKTWVGDGSTFLPAWITFQNLEITGAYTKTPNSITLLDGSTASWNNGAGIYLKHSRDVTIRNCKLHGNSFGVFTFNSADSMSQTNIRTTIAFNSIFGNGVVGSYLEHNCYVQGISPLIFGNYIGELRAGAFGSSYKSRASGETICNNFFESSARAIDMVHAEESYSTVTAQPNYAFSYCFGNIISNTASTGAYTLSPVHFGGDNAGEDTDTPLQVVGYNATPLRYREHLFFWDNTYISDGGPDKSNFFDLSLIGGNKYYDGYTASRTRVSAWNNVFQTSGDYQGWVENVGEVYLTNKNYVVGSVADHLSYTARTNQVLIDKTGVISGSTAGFQDLASSDLHPTSSSALVGTGTMGASPVSVQGFIGYSNPYQPLGRMNGVRPRTIQSSNISIGAMERIDTSTIYCTMVPKITGSTTVGSQLTCSVGTWSQPVSSTSFQWFINGKSTANTGSQLTVTADLVNATCYCVVQVNGSSKIRSTTFFIGTVPAVTNATFGWGAPNTDGTSGGSTGGTSGGSTGGTSGGSTGSVAPAASVAPFIVGSATVGGELIVLPGTWSNATAFSYEWFIDGGVVEMTQVLTVTAAMSGKTVSARVYATGPGSEPFTTVVGNADSNSVVIGDAAQTPIFQSYQFADGAKADMIGASGHVAYFEFRDGKLKVTEAAITWGVSIQVPFAATTNRLRFGLTKTEASTAELIIGMSSAGSDVAFLRVNLNNNTIMALDGNRAALNNGVTTTVVLMNDVSNSVEFGFESSTTIYVVMNGKKHTYTVATPVLSTIDKYSVYLADAAGKQSETGLDFMSN